MQRYIILTLLTFSLLLSEEADHVIFSKITIRPNDAEMVSIHNPTESIIESMEEKTERANHIAKSMDRGEL